MAFRPKSQCLRNYISRGDAYESISTFIYAKFLKHVIMEVQMNNTIEYQNIQENRKYKDSLFRMVFAKKEDLLKLYNAVNDTNYSNAEELEVNTLENVLYISMKNDVSFIVGCTLNLYEHQSTENENMPLRGLFYLAKVYEKYVNEHGLNIYKKKMLKLPTPSYIVFYNGSKNDTDERIMRLSDSFIKEGGCLELEARLLNINYGHNRELMEKCRRLEEYAIFVSRVRNRMTNRTMSLKQALTLTMDECIKEGILYDILTKQRDEVFGMILSTFNKELYERDLKQDAYEDGLEDGFEKGQNDKLLEQIQKKLSKGKSIEIIADELEEDIQKITELIDLLTIR